jgi:glycosyltransferase involved in cell wall biosynthesis
MIYIADTRMPTEMAHGLQIMKMCEAFVKNGAELELVIPMRFGISSLSRKDPFEYYKVERIFKIRKIFCFDLTPLNRFLGPVSYLVQALSFSFFTSIYLLFRRTDIIYSRDRFSLFFLALFLSRLPRCEAGRKADKKNIVFEMHKTHKSLLRFLLKRIKKFVVITNGLKAFLMRKGVPENKILIAPDGIDLEDFSITQTKEECRQKLNLPQDKKLVIYTGQLYKWKDVETLALASRFLDGNYLIVIVGGIKWYLSKFKKFIQKNNLKNILCLGHRDYAEIPYFLKSADCLVLTGTQQSETSKNYTSPLKMFEYMASNRPIVASDLPSFREILNENNAILIQPDSPEAMAKGIKNVLTDLGLVEKISNQAFQDVQKYTWQKRAEKVIHSLSA